MKTFEANNTLLNQQSQGEEDPFFNNVSLLLHMDGGNGSTTFTDNSRNNYSITRIGSGTISTTQNKFGGSSYFSNVLNNELSVPGFLYEPGDFTFECWWYPREFTNGYKSFFSTSGLSTKYGFFTNDDLTSRRVFFARYEPSFQLITDGLNGLSIPLNSWNHVALTKSGNIIRTFFNGTVLQTANLNENLIGTEFEVGRQFTQNPEFGFLDEVRLTQGVARYISNFAVPTTPFPNFGPPLPQRNLSASASPPSNGGHITGYGTLSNPITGYVAGYNNDGAAYNLYLTALTTGTLNYNFTVSSEAGYDYGYLSVNNVLIFQIDGSQNRTGSVSITNGQQVRIGYTKDGSDSAGSDRLNINSLFIS